MVAENYTAESWATYIGKINLNIIINNLRSEISVCTDAIYEAQLGLVIKEPISLTEYENLIGLVKESDYTAEYWNAYHTIVSNHSINEYTEKSILDEVCLIIKEAQTKLIKKPVDQGGNGGDGGSSIPAPTPVVPPVVPPIIPPIPQAPQIITIEVGGNQMAVPVRENIILRDNITGYISGYTNNTFRPNNSITRAETSQIISNISKESRLLKPELTDIEGKWYSQSVEKVISLGLMRGYDNKTFKPKSNLTRQEFAVTPVNMLDLSKMPSIGDKTFKDTDNFYGKESIKLLASLGILQGYSDGTFKPDAEISRIEVVVIINRLLGSRINAEEFSNKEFTDINDSWAKDEILRAIGR